MTDQEMRSKFFELTKKLSSSNSVEYIIFYEAILFEREECAKMVDHILRAGGGTYGDFIRERSNVKLRGA